MDTARIVLAKGGGQKNHINQGICRQCPGKKGGMTVGLLHVCCFLFSVVARVSFLALSILQVRKSLSLSTRQQ